MPSLEERFPGLNFRPPREGRTHVIFLGRKSSHEGDKLARDHQIEPEDLPWVEFEEDED